MAGVINPGQRRGLMDQVQQGLQIASTVYGIKSQMDEQDFRDEQRVKSASDAEEVAKGHVTPGEFRNMALMKGLEQAKEGDPGAQPFYEKGSGSILGWLKKSETPKLTPDNSMAEKRLAFDREKFDYEKTQNSKKGSGGSAAVADANGTKDFKKLPQENQIQVKELATTMGKQSSINNLLASMLDEFRNAESDDQKVAVGGRMLKVINSPLGADAIGAEEANRLGSFLEKKFFNFRQPGSVFGRDLDEFETQVAGQVESLNQAISLNQSMIDKLSGREGGASVASQTPKGGPKEDTSGKAFAGPGGGKPKTVVQGGHTYTLNEKTGEYE